jgi:hypothetical protein
MVRNNFAGMSAVPLAASALLVAGAALGSLGGYQIALHHARQTNTATVTAPTMSAEAQTASATTAATSVNSAEIASVSSVVRQPHNGLVEIHYNRLVPQTMQGSIDDPAIQKLLSTASRNKESNNARSESVNLLATECRSGHACQTADVRDSLMVALRYDTRASVREKALQGLERYISQDVRVRDAVLGALMNDPSPRVRTAAVSLLEPVEGDTSVRQVLHSVADSDQNPYIRTVSRQVLNQVPEIQ